MRFLIDVRAGQLVASWLRASGHDVEEVRSRARDMEDEEILAWAHDENRIVVTVDKDFGTLAVALGQPHHGIVRLPDVPAIERQQLMASVIARHDQELTEGALVTVIRQRIRVRRS